MSISAKSDFRAKPNYDNGACYTRNWPMTKTGRGRGSSRGGIPILYRTRADIYRGETQQFTRSVLISASHWNYHHRRVSIFEIMYREPLRCISRRVRFPFNEVATSIEFSLSSAVERFARRIAYLPISDRSRMRVTYKRIRGDSSGHNETRVPDGCSLPLNAVENSARPRRE